MKRIIFIDDDPGIQDIARLVFEKAGYEIHVLSSGVSLFAGTFEVPDIIILDKRLPEMDGLDICRRLKASKETNKIPVIILSANPDIQSMAMASGADEVIEKPFTLKELREAVERLVEGQAEPRRSCRAEP